MYFDFDLFRFIVFIAYFRLQKAVKDILRLLQSRDTGPWTTSKVSNLERAIGVIGRILDKKVYSRPHSLG